MALLEEVAVKYFTKRAEEFCSKNNVQKIPMVRIQRCMSQAPKDVLKYFQLNYGGKLKTFFMRHPERFMVDSENNLLLLRRPPDSSVEVKPHISQNVLADENLKETEVAPLSQNMVTLGFLSAFLKTNLQPVPLSVTSLAYTLMNDDMKKFIGTCEGHSISAKIASFLRSYWFFEISKSKKIHFVLQDDKDKEAHHYLLKAENCAVMSMCISYILQGHTDIKQIYLMLNDKHRFLLTKFLGIEKFITFLHEHRNIFFLPGDGTVHTTLDPVKKEPVLSKLKFLKTVNKNLDTSTINNRDLPSLQTGKPQSTRYVDVKECNNGAVQNSQVNSAFIHVEGELGQQSDVLSSPTQSISTGESQYTDSCCSVKPQVTMACESTSENYCETIYSTENEGDSKEISANLPNLPEEHVKIWQFVKEVVGFVVYVGKEGSIIQCVLNNAKGRIYCLVYYFNNSYDYDDRGWKVPTLSVLKVGSLVRCIIDDNIGYQFSDKVMMFAKNIILQGNSGTNGVPCSLPEMTETTDCSNDRKVENLVSRFLTKTDGNNDDNSVVEKKRTNLSCTKTSNVNNTTHLSVLSDNFYSTYFEDEKLNARDSFHILSTPDEAVTQPEPSTGPNLHTQQPLFVFSETNCSRSGAASEEAKESNASVGNTDPYSQQERSSRDNQQDNRCEGTIDDVDTTYLAGFQDATKILMQVQMEIGSILAQKRNRYKRPEDILDDTSKDYSSEKGFYENFQSKIGHQTKTEIITLNSSCQTISTGPVYIKKLFC